MTANVILRFILLYGVPAAALDRAAADITAALGAGDLTGLPVHKFPLADIAAAQEAAEAGVDGQGHRHALIWTLGPKRRGRRIARPGSWLPPGRAYFFGEDPGALGPAVEDLRADPVELAAALAPAAAPVRAGEDGAEVPAAHVAARALAERVNSQRHQVADRDYDNNEYQHRRAPILLARKPPAAPCRSHGPGLATQRELTTAVGARGRGSPLVPTH